MLSLSSFVLEFFEYLLLFESPSAYRMMHGIFENLSIGTVGWARWTRRWFGLGIDGAVCTAHMALEGLLCIINTQSLGLLSADLVVSILQ
jgi:hypothetical protein